MGMARLGDVRPDGDRSPSPYPRLRGATHGLHRLFQAHAGDRGREHDGNDPPPRLALLALMVVCFVDVMGQGLAFPIFDTLLLKPGSGFLPQATSRSRAELLYSVAIGTFFLTWLFGSIYVARLSDSIGRKRGILICLLGAFAGYALAAAAIPLRSYPLLVVSRAITGFTAGTQPIAAAAMIDLARSEAESTRKLGLANVGVSGVLVIGPIIGGVFSDPALLGPWDPPPSPSWWAACSVCWPWCSSPAASATPARRRHR